MAQPNQTPGDALKAALGNHRAAVEAARTAGRDLAAQPESGTPSEQTGGGTPAQSTTRG
jgi:hypothetical protein